MKYILRLFFILIIPIFCYIFAKQSPYYATFVMTKSINMHFAIYEKINDYIPQKYDYIIFRFDNKDQKIEKGSILAKEILCTPNEFLVVNQDLTKCDVFEFRKPEKIDSFGKKIQSFEYNGIIPENKYFVVGSTLKSYDSRYWGFVDKKDILGKIIWWF